MIGKPKVIIFGASKGGKNFIKHQSTYEIIGATDNDKVKHNGFIENYSIHAPHEIKNIDYDYIVITSMYIKEIKEQLIQELKVIPTRIIVAPKAQLKDSYEPFKDPETMKFAKRKLLELTQLFKENEITYFADFGTLLGIIRERDLIEWDDDVDLSILASDFEKLKNFIKGKLHLLNTDTGVKWSGYIMYSNNQPVSVSLKFQNDINLKSFQVNIGIISFKDNLAIQTFNQVPKHHFLTQQIVAFEDGEIAVPNNYEAYLTHTYGDWKTPKKGSTYEDYSIVQDDLLLIKRRENL